MPINLKSIVYKKLKHVAHCIIQYMAIYFIESSRYFDSSFLNYWSNLGRKSKCEKDGKWREILQFDSFIVSDLILNIAKEDIKRITNILQVSLGITGIIFHRFPFIIFHLLSFVFSEYNSFSIMIFLSV